VWQGPLGHVVATGTGGVVKAAVVDGAAGAAVVAGAAEQTLHESLQVAFMKAALFSHSPREAQAEHEGLSSLHAEPGANVGAAVDNAAGAVVVAGALEQTLHESLQLDFMNEGFLLHSPREAQA